jgi:hypothetical protein
MNVYETKDIASLVRGNPYVGRGIVIGKSENGKYACTAYFIMGRSANSRNRVFAERDGALFTEPFDASKVEDPSLIIYAALRQVGERLIVTNGDQTETICHALRAGGTFSGALTSRAFEPDGPNFTPRISGMLTFVPGNFSYEMSILKSADETGSACCRFTFSYPSVAGVGHFLHTYITDGKPLPSFCGEPERTVIPDDIDVFTDALWNALDEENRISLYVRYTDLTDGTFTRRLINKNQ